MKSLQVESSGSSGVPDSDSECDSGDSGEGRAARVELEPRGHALHVICVPGGTLRMYRYTKEINGNETLLHYVKAVCGWGHDACAKSRTLLPRASGKGPKAGRLGTSVLGCSLGKRRW